MGGVLFSQLFIYKMQNNQNHSTCKCQGHCFSLKALHKERRTSLNVTVTMCRSKNNKNKKNKDKCANFEGASFNKDRCYATPAFILPSEKVEYIASTREFIRDHDKKVKQYEEELDDLLIPKPRSKNMYCNVCRENYEQYIDHIRSSLHRTNIRNSHFNGYILDLEKKFKTAERKQFSLSLNQTGSGTTGDDDVEIIGATGRKQRKIINVDESNGTVYPFMDPNQNPTMPTYNPNIFFNTPDLSQPYRMMAGFNNCRNFYQPFNALPFNPYFPYATENQYALNYPFYCMPYQPCLNLQIFQQQF